MFKLHILKKILIGSTLLFLAIGAITAQARDMGAGTHAPSAGVAPAAAFPPIEALPTPGPQAPALLGNIYGDESVNAVVARFDIGAPGTIVPIAPSNLGGDFASAGTFGADSNFFYSVGFASSDLNAVDATTGLRTFIGTLTPPVSGNYSGMTYDPTTDTFYIVSTDISTSVLYTVDVVNATTTPVGPITNAPGAIALVADGVGNLYTYDILNDVGLSVNKLNGAGTVLGPIGFDANFAQGMAYDPLTDTIYLAAFNNGAFQAELRSFDRLSGNTTFLGVIGPGDLREFTYAAIPSEIFSKQVVAGNDFDFNGIPDKVVEVGSQFFGASYFFAILYYKPLLPPVIIRDVVPREWDVTWLGGAYCDVVRADERRNLFSDNFITCYPPPGAPSGMVFQADARCFDVAGDPSCHPKECGAFFLNEGATMQVGRTPLDVTDPLCLAAVRDVNGFGLVYDGTGDEDGDGVDDYTEACVNFTDPCSAPLAPSR